MQNKKWLAMDYKTDDLDVRMKVKADNKTNKFHVGLYKRYEYETSLVSIDFNKKEIIIHGGSSAFKDFIIRGLK